MPQTDELYMRRCLELALGGAGQVAPNPMVGAVLVHENRIIGEGYHQQYGQAHAEVNCLANVAEADHSLVPSSTLYVSLEPCAHFGKTPPCSDLIVRYGIPKVVVGCRDPFPQVNGKGVEKLEQAGVAVVTGVLEKECRELNRRFFTQVEKQRPYLILKWAQSVDGKIAGASTERLLITNGFTNRLVHQWRSEEAAIMVGTNTALLDDPSLTNRLWTGENPVKLLLDLSLRLPLHLKIFQGEGKTIVFNATKDEKNGSIEYHTINGEDDVIPQITEAAYRNGLQSILVEGGARLLQSFIDADLWDEARIITNETLSVAKGLSAPLLKHATKFKEEKMSEDRIEYFRRNG